MRRSSRIFASVTLLAALAACGPEGVMEVQSAYEQPSKPVSQGLAVAYATFDGRACPGTVRIDAERDGTPDHDAAHDTATRKAKPATYRLEANVTEGTVALAPRRMPAGRYRVTRVMCRADAFADAPSVRYAKPVIETFTVRAGHIARVGVIDVRSPAPLSQERRRRMNLAAIAAHTRAATHRLRPFRAEELRGI